jgi:hypothetical protein
MVIEVVALADTREIPVDREEYLAALGRIIVERRHAVLEVANEPGHGTQAPDVHRSEVLAGLRARVPAAVPVALGSVEWGDGFADADYVTWHVPRLTSHEGWGHVLAIAEGDALARRWKKPLVSDEPIGAGSRFEPGRRDDVPARFRAAALLTRLVGLGATFHYEGGLQAAIPAGRELECFNVAWVLVVKPRAGFSATWGAGWNVERVRRLEGAWIIRARRRAS